MNYESVKPFLDGKHKYQEYKNTYSAKPMYIVYSLKLKKNRYYIGKTDNFRQRYAKHKSKYGCTQTKKYPVVSVDKIIVTNLPFMELQLFFEYTQRFGISNVRGDLFHRDRLPLYQEDYIQREIYHEENKCISCGSSSHFISQCPTKQHFNRFEQELSMVCVPTNDENLNVSNVPEQNSMMSSFFRFIPYSFSNFFSLFYK